MRLDVLNHGYRRVPSCCSWSPGCSPGSRYRTPPGWSSTGWQAYQDGAKVRAVLADLDSAPIEAGLRATLRMLGTLTREGKVGAGDMRPVLSAGVSREQVEDALAVCAAFNTTDRLADAFGFEVLSPAGFEAGAKYLLKRGYR